jgi:sugar phosphate isomerase/epimerase
MTAEVEMRDFSNDHRWLSINTATVRKQGNLIEIVDALARHGIRGISPWRDQVADVGLDRAVKAVRDAGLELSGYCRGGMFTADAAHLQEARDDNRRAVDEAAALGAPCLVLVVGGLPHHSRPGSKPSKDLAAAQRMVEEEVGVLLDYARKSNMPLAIEPLHPGYAADRACVNTMRHALDICDRLDPARSGDVGLAVDLYHVWWDYELFDQIKRAGRSRILAFHVCDWLVPTKDLLLDRGMMGDGVIDLKGIRKMVEDAGYDAPIDVEIFSAENWWKRDPDEVLRVCAERFRTVV